MMTEDYNNLMNLYQELRQELSELDAQIDSNLQGIKQAEIFLQDFEEPEDHEIFSPRMKKVIFKEKIDQILEEKAEYQNKNQKLLQKRNVLAERVRKLEKALDGRDYNLAILKVQEKDRQRIARELHDTSLQSLTHLVHKIELGSMYIDTDPIQAKLELSIANKYLKEVIEEIRGTIFDIRPMIFDDLGIKAALERLLSDINESGRFEIDADIDNVSCETNIVLVSIYRIVQEAFVNIVKHSDAKKVIFRFKKKEEKCVIEIEDDGKGFSEESVYSGKHFGISLMKERVELLNGTISIVSKEGKGTKISVEIPL